MERTRLIVSHELSQVNAVLSKAEEYRDTIGDEVLENLRIKQASLTEELKTAKNPATFYCDYEHKVMPDGTSERKVVVFKDTRNGAWGHSSPKAALEDFSKALNNDLASVARNMNASMRTLERDKKSKENITKELEEITTFVKNKSYPVRELNDRL